ncbi:MAG: 4Fe-4S dicluster domain-containing protein [Eubacterium sp.]|nr:4Fe-4S dicluster domain-containing protein [Eubacterium sp.]
MSLTDQIAAAGVVGLGGAGFPTHRKLTGSFTWFIVNGAECEPLLRTDRYMMRHEADRIVRAVAAVQKELQIPHAVIALKKAYLEEAEALEQAIKKQQADISLHYLESFYPAGDEQTIVYEVTGKVVPPGGIPGAVGAVVDNVGTMCAIADALEGKPLIRKKLTVTGLVAHPIIADVPVGTSVRRCVELAGGPTAEQFFVINGGPMMGRPVPPEEYDTAVVTKTTSGILVLPAQGPHERRYRMPMSHMLNQAKSACIQCSFCTELCPRYLLGHPLQPHRIMRKMAHAGTGHEAELLQDPDIQAALICCECGVCETYACPMSLRPRTVNAYLKQKLGKAGIRYAGSREQDFAARAPRELRKVPSRKAAVRNGVGAFYDYEIRELIADTPDEVTIPLRMHIGAPSEPVIGTGDTVRAGDVIAVPPEGALGAVIHASIDGTAEVGSGCIRIRKSR